MIASLIVAVSLSAIGLRGSTTCPTVQAVQAELGDLVTNDGDLHWAELTSRADSLQLALWSPHGRLEAVRTIPLPASCEALARASAVAIATWAVSYSNAAEAPATAPAPPVVIEPTRIFATSLLEAERLRLEQSPPPPVRTVSVRGPVLTMAAGWLVQIAALVAGFMPGQLDTNRSVVVIGAGMLGMGARIGGFMWLLGLSGSRAQDDVFVF